MHKELNKLLASYQVFYQKLLVYHWNLEDKKFFSYHQAFEDMYVDAQEKIDTIAERVRVFEAKTIIGLKACLEESVVEDVQKVPGLDDMVKDLLKSMNQIADLEREILGKLENDYGTEDMLGAFLRDLEKQMWMLKSCVK